MKNNLKAVEQHQASGGCWQFGYDKMYETLLEHPVCKKSLREE